MSRYLTPPAVPKSGNAASRWLGRSILRLFRADVEGNFPDVAKAMVLVYPHTSNWDFLLGMGAKWALSLDVSFLAKHTLFGPPLGRFLRWLGGIPVDRRASAGVADTVVARLEASERLYVVITPEGTRGKVSRWKTGFHRIARGAGVPVVPILFDWSRRVVRIDPPLAMTDDVEADIARLQALAHPGMARRPELFWGA